MLLVKSMRLSALVEPMTRAVPLTRKVLAFQTRSAEVDPPTVVTRLTVALPLIAEKPPSLRDLSPPPPAVPARPAAREKLPPPLISSTPPIRLRVELAPPADVPPPRLVVVPRNVP